MNLKKCLKGHLFDKDKYENCPFCGAVQWNKDLNGTEPKTRQPLEDEMVEGDDGNAEKDAPKGKEGTALSDSKDASIQDYVVCLNCKRKNDIDAKFCEACGKPIVPKANSLVTEYKPKKPDWSNAVVGWIVGIKGKYFGKSFEIYPGRNSIGKSEKSSINLSEDKMVKDGCMAWLTYDPKKNKYYFQPGDGRGLVYVNNEIVLNARLLIDRDRLEIGDGEYAFVPLCDVSFSWEKYINGLKD